MRQLFKINTDPLIYIDGLAFMLCIIVLYPPGAWCFLHFFFKFLNKESHKQ